MKDAASPLGSRRWPAQTHTGCVWLPQLQLRAEILRHPAWDGRPVVMSGGPRERKTVQLCSPEAELAGLRPGLPLREVLPLCPDAIVLQPDPVRTAAVLEDVLRQLQLVTPRVEMSRPLWVSPGKRAALGVFAGQEMAFLDLRGSEQVYEHSFDALEQAIHAAVPWLLQPRLGLAGGKFAAAVAAQTASPRSRQVVPAVETAAFLDPLSIRFLPFASEAIERLELLGMHTIGQLGALPFSAVQAQFGRAGAQSWRLAHGQDGEPIAAESYVPTVRAALRCDDPPSSVEAILAALDQLLSRAFSQPAMRGCSARQVRLRALLADGSSWERSFTFKEPLSGKDAMRRTLWGKLKAANTLPPAPVEELYLELLGRGPETARQLPLFGHRLRQRRDLAQAAQQLAARYGHMPLYRPVEVEPWSRIPEQRWALTPFDP